MSAFDELARQCERRGWRLSFDGTYPDGKNQPGLILNHLSVRSSSRTNREQLATAVAGPSLPELEGAALDCAKALAMQGLIG